ncbi:hypothetical protein [Streptomyces sp. NPDC058622]|uniref:hypothetical protein n=1 Tax=Streptomyces sp. NPDC058622 TaxID=3346562 RepID=UPI00364B44AF
MHDTEETAVDQSAREEQLRAEAERNGVSPAAIQHAVEVIAAVQRRDRDDYRANFGGELTLDQWFEGYGTEGFNQLLTYAAGKAGLGDGGPGVLRRVLTAAALAEQDPTAESPAHRLGFAARPVGPDGFVGYTDVGVSRAAEPDPAGQKSEEDADDSGPMILFGEHPEHGWIADGLYDDSIVAILEQAGFCYDSVLATHRIPAAVDPWVVLRRVARGLQQHDVGFLILDAKSAAEAAGPPPRSDL